MTATQTTRRKEPEAAALRTQFDSALAAYISDGDELLLEKAYELGRSALESGWPIPDLVSAHGRALQRCLTDALDGGHAARMAGAAAEFLADTLAPFEMTHRGYHEALIAVRHLNETLEGEVRRIAHALHDEAGQLLVSVHLALADLERVLPRAVRTRMRELNGLVDQVERRLRDLSHELRPTVLDDLGWLPALQFLADAVARRARLSITVHSEVEQRLPAAVETALYRAVQETLTNVVRHARASTVRIEITTARNWLCCEVIDDGIGFDATDRAASPGMGLIGIRERLSALGGRLNIESVPGQGTRVRLEFPGAA